eukprot:360794-Chlamydomonas_euryale.AAC.7
MGHTRPKKSGSEAVVEGRKWSRMTPARHNNLSAGCFGLSLNGQNMDSECFGCLDFHISGKPPAHSD